MAINEIQYYIHKGEGLNGQKSHRVRAAQEMLFYLGFLTTAPDGQFYVLTEKAVKKAQKAYGFEENGIIDVELLQRLAKETILQNPKEY